MPRRGKIAFVGTGGTISMTYNERQEGFVPTKPAEALLELLPQDIAGEIEPVDWSHQPSSHYTIRMTTDLVDLLGQLVQDGCKGIVVSSGTDALEEMSYLTDLLWLYPQPVVFTGALKPASQPSSDAAVNLRQAIAAASSEALWGMGVVACFQDQLFAASEITKEVSHRRDAFASPGKGPIGEFVEGKIRVNRKPKRPPSVDRGITPSKDVEILWASLGGGVRTLTCLSSGPGLEGLVLAGFGGGNVPPSWIQYIKALLKAGTQIVVTSKCPRGYTITEFGFEGSARKLFELGVLDGGMLRPEQARLRLAVGLGAGYKGNRLQEYLLGGE
ncbi:MAG: asparaginase [Thermovirgaceae bacterium]